MEADRFELFNGKILANGLDVAEMRHTVAASCSGPESLPKATQALGAKEHHKTQLPCSGQ